MSHDLAGADAIWDTATWDSGTGTAPFGSTWAAEVQGTDLAARMLDDPTTLMGASLGPHASGGLRFVVQALNPDAGTDSEWDSALWDSGIWSASVGNWVDISSYVRGITWKQGQGQPSGRAVVGTSTITLANRDGVVSPWATSGPFVGGGARSWVRAGLIVRFGVIKTSTLAAGLPTLATFSPFFTGKVDTTDEGTSDNTDAWVTITLVETTVDLATAPADQPTESYRWLSETIYEALFASGWRYQTALTVPSEDTLVADTTLSGGSTTERLQLLADGEHWDIVADGRGRVIVVQRRIASSDSGVTFSNQPAGAELPMTQDTTPYSSAERVINEPTAARVNGGPVTLNDSASITQFGMITSLYGFPRNDLVLSADAAVTALIRRVLSLRAFDDLGIATINLDADMDAVNLPAVMTYIACRAREGISFNVRWVHPSLNQFFEAVVVEGQEHSLTMQGGQAKWTSTLSVGHAGTTSGS